MTLTWQKLKGTNGPWTFETFDTLSLGSAEDRPAVATWQTTYEVTVHEVRSANAADWPEQPLADDDPARAFLDPEAEDVARVRTECPDFETVAATLQAPSGTAWERARRTWMYVQTRHGTYGECLVRSSLFCALMRRQGVPARLISGICSRRWEHHLWAEYYLPGYGWTPVEWIPGSGFEVVSAKHIVFWRGSPGAKPRGPDGRPTTRPVVRGGSVDAVGPIAARYSVSVVDEEPEVPAIFARTWLP